MNIFAKRTTIMSGQNSLALRRRSQSIAASLHATEEGTVAHHGWQRFWHSTPRPRRPILHYSCSSPTNGAAVLARSSTTDWTTASSARCHRHDGAGNQGRRAAAARLRGSKERFGVHYG